MGIKLYKWGIIVEDTQGKKMMTEEIVVCNGD